jgi:Spy/CpxP family protein refolding chaperone
MKKKICLALIAVVVLSTAWTVFAQREGGGERSAEGRRRGQNLTEEQRTRMREMRERWQNMSEEEREKARAEMRQRFGGRGRRMGREDQLKAIEDAEKQLAKLKKGIQAQPTERRSFRDMSEEERNKMREQFTKAREERNKAFKAIITQIARLQGQRQPAEGEELLIINTAQLKSIQELAVKEKAKETAQRLERLVRPRMGFFGGGRPTGGRPPASSTTGGATERPRRRSTQ